MLPLSKEEADNERKFVKNSFLSFSLFCKIFIFSIELPPHTSSWYTTERYIQQKKGSLLKFPNRVFIKQNLFGIYNSSLNLSCLTAHINIKSTIDVILYNLLSTAWRACLIHNSNTQNLSKKKVKIFVVNWECNTLNKGSVRVAFPFRFYNGRKAIIRFTTKK